MINFLYIFLPSIYYKTLLIKALNTENKERILRAAKEKGQVGYKGRPISIIPDSQWKQ